MLWNSLQCCSQLQPTAAAAFTHVKVVHIFMHHACLSVFGHLLDASTDRHQGRLEDCTIDEAVWPCTVICVYTISLKSQYEATRKAQKRSEE